MPETSNTPTVDFTYQFNLSKERVEKRIFNIMCKISTGMNDSKSRIGILVVLGKFAQTVSGMRSFGSQKVDKYLNVIFSNFESEVLSMFSTGNDGAIIINQGGEVLGSGVYLMVDHPSLDIPEGTGTRHISAASFSIRNDVLATFTLSEETNIVRTWKNGLLSEQFNPDEIGDEE